MMSELKGPEGKLLGLSVAAAGVAFVVVFKISRAIIPGDVSMLLGSILATYAGVAMPWLILKTMSPAQPQAQPTASPA